MKKEIDMNGDRYIVEELADGRRVVSRNGEVLAGEDFEGEVLLVLAEYDRGRGTAVTNDAQSPT